MPMRKFDVVDHNDMRSKKNLGIAEVFVYVLLLMLITY